MPLVSRWEALSLASQPSSISGKAAAWEQSVPKEGLLEAPTWLTHYSWHGFGSLHEESPLMGYPTSTNYNL
jgi:hypothetical protein